MSLDDCQRKHTHRQYLAWQRWLDEQLNRPGVVEHYLMQIDRTIRILVNTFTRVKLKLGFADIQIKWSSPTKDGIAEADWNELPDEEQETIIQEAADAQKQRWGIALAVAQGQNLNRESQQ